MLQSHRFTLPRPSRRAALLGTAVALLLAACASLPPPLDPPSQLRAANRIGWGATTGQLDQIATQGWGRYVEQQLNADPKAPLPAFAEAQIAQLDITSKTLNERVQEVETLRKNQDKPPTEAERVVARQAYQNGLNKGSREAGHRFLLRALYSDQQLLEHISAFWFNHFNVHQYKREIRVLVSDYEDRALRPNALGSFRTMLGAVARHPAMLRYLDNDQNGIPRVNENYARELLELHTLGVDGGYSQRDVQELARVLTGFGVRLDPEDPKLPPKFNGQYVREGLYEFNPARHDFGDKQLLGQTIKGSGAKELDQVLDLLVAHPSTARFVSRKLAQFFLADQPPAAVVERMAAAFQQSGGDIKATLRPLLLSSEFASLPPAKFKDPQHYLLSGLRAGFEGQQMLNSQPLAGWLRRLGQGLYDRQTPDGYPPQAEAWNSAGQMSLRFEIARQMGGGVPALFKGEAADAPKPPPPPYKLDAPPMRSRIEPSLSPATRGALAQADSPQLWLTLLLSSPEFMNR
ncbi:DUF1800 domain-containing protein [Pelomonas sp. SE-A7]|uniref:DUF1800 domain-containing protein n=1 Tax=Pelomonas sp. SE-A7 TaxID=3054953 RepID=UPI00259CF18F|nr:DUF1800 domain-containing protein [Pelomonas sp. SE-A7]MDM4766486.1 DUF1800 domain-containing protein [Pelomonas sp. SE-A7]